MEVLGAGLAAALVAAAFAVVDLTGAALAGVALTGVGLAAAARPEGVRVRVAREDMMKAKSTVSNEEGNGMR